MKGSEAGSQAVPQVLQPVQPGRPPVLATAGFLDNILERKNSLDFGMSEGTKIKIL